MTNESDANGKQPDQPAILWDRFLLATTGTRFRFGMVIFWIIVVGVSAPLAASIGDVENNDASSYLPASSESLKASELLDEFDSGDTIAAVAVYHRDGGLNQADLAAIEADRTELAGTFPSFLISPAIPSEDGLANIYTVVMPDTTDSQLTDDVEAVRETLASGATEGLTIKVTGPAGIGVDLGKVFEGINGRLLLSAAAVVAVLLLLTYRSPFLWILPLVVVGLADRLANAALYVLGKGFDVPINGQSVGIMAILVFGAGTDYALLLIARYREELRNFERNADAMRVALRMAAPSILASAGTVMLALACLLFADLNSNRALGPAGVVGIICSVVVTLTLLPALLVICGRGVFWPFVPRYDKAHVDAEHFWSRIGHFVARQPRRIWIGTTVCLAILTLGIANYSISFDLVDQFTDTPESIEGVVLIAESYPAGASQPTSVVGRLDHAQQIQEIVAAVPNVASVRQSGQTDSLVSFDVTLISLPGTSQAFDDVQNLRSALEGVPEAEALVGGPDAESFDTELANARDEKVIIPLVLAVVFLVLCILLRSLFAPLLLVATSVISTVAALGVAVVFFTQILDYGGMQPGVLLIGFVFLIALGVDYNIFLMGRAHEEAKRVGTRQGMLKSISVTGSVITSAGIVLAATFAVLGLLPLVALAQIGFLVAFGVLLDTVIVRSILVPAITFDAGKKIWWPSELSKREGSD